MGYIEEMSLTDTSLPTLKIKKNDLYKIYPYIASGGEGTVFRYDEKTVIKIFNMFPNKNALPLKFKKIEAIGTINDESLITPRGIVGYTLEHEIIDISLDTSDIEGFTKALLDSWENLLSRGSLKEGIFMDAVDCHPEYGSFSKLYCLKDLRKILDIILKADKAIERLHKKGFRIGDIKPDNILIDKNWNPKFIDSDNMAYGEFSYDLIASNSRLLGETFGKKYSRRDADIYLFSIMALGYFLLDRGMLMGEKKDFLQKLVEYLKIDPVLKDGLRLIFSDAENKPYIGPILEKMKPDAFEFTGMEKMVLTHLL